MVTRADAGASVSDDLRWKRGSWLALCASIALVIIALLSLVYRLSITTDGWVIDDNAESDGRLRHDALELGSGLQPGDNVLRIQDIGEPENSFMFKVNQSAYAPQWRSGATVNYVVQRAGQTLTVPVTLGNWTLRGFLGSHGSETPLYVIETIRVILQLLIGIYVFVRRPGNAAAQVLLFLGAIDLAQWLVLLLPIGVQDMLDPVAVLPVALIGYYGWGILRFPTIVLMSLVFPKPKNPYRKFPVPTLLLLYSIVAVLVFAVGFGSELSILIGFGSVAVFALLTIMSVIHTVIVARHDAVMRAQILWVGIGLGIVAATVAINNILGLGFVVPGDESSKVFSQVGNAIFELLRLALPATLAIAILRYRLFDIDVIIRRTLTYGVLTLLLGTLYIGLITVLQQGLVALTGRSDSQLVTVASTLAVAGAFLPLRNRIQSAIDQRFYRRRFDAEQVTARFATEMRDAVALDEVADGLFDAVEDTMQPHKMVLWLPSEERKI